MKKTKKAIRQLGKRIRAMRLDRGWSQDHLGFLIDVEQTYISAVERGVYSPSFAKIVELADAFEVSLSEFLEGIGTEKKENLVNG